MSPPFRIVFLGTSPFAVPSLKALASDPRFKIELVITQPDRPVGRRQILTPSAVKIEAMKLGLTVTQPENIEELQANSYKLQAPPSLLITISYGQLLPQSLLDWATIASVNVHASLLPKLRGASPIQHAILENFKATGVTVQRMVKELDAGPILSQESIEIDDRETFQTLHDKLADLGAKLLIETLMQPLKETNQDLFKATFCRKLSRENGMADPTSMNASMIDRMVRALTPWPGVSINGNKILETSLMNHADALSMPCSGDSTLYVTTIQPPSGKPMTGRAFALGHKVMP